MAEELHGARLKLARAIKHVDDLADVTNAVYDTKADPPFTVVQKYNREHGYVRISVKDIREPPPGLSVLIGDALHNFRSALDNVAWALARRHKGRVPRSKVQFPIVRSRKEFEGRITQAQIREIAPDDRLVIENFQAYRRIWVGELRYPLLVLSSMSNRDKHRLLHLVVMGSEMLNISVKDKPPSVNCIVGEIHIAEDAVDAALKSHREIARVDITPTGPNAQAQIDVTWRTGISIQEQVWRGPMRTVNVLTRLRKIGVYVDDVIETFAPTF